MQPFSRTSRTVALVTSIVGGVVLLGVGSTAALATFGPAFSPSSNSTGTGDTQSIDIGEAGGATISGLEVESNAANFELTFGDVSEATLEVAGEGRARWEMRIDDGDLIVQSKGNFFNWCIGWCHFDTQQVTLTLPKQFDSVTLDADFQVNSGSLTADGSWNDLDLQVNAGELNLTGSARSLDASVNAGRATIEADGVREADLEIAAGRLDAELTGNQPQAVSLDVSAGQLRLTVPEGSYDVRSDVSAGSLDNQLNISRGSSHRIDADISAGTATLRTP